MNGIVKLVSGVLLDLRANPQWSSGPRVQKAGEYSAAPSPFAASWGIETGPR